MNEIEFSIIIPLYNQEKYIEECLKSALGQSFQGKFEVIVVNDGSTDNSEEILKKFNDEKLCVFKNENLGPAYSRNFGIKQSKGKYIVFLDSDDILEKDALKIFYNTIYCDNKKYSDTDIVFAPYYAIRGHRNDTKFYFPLEKFKDFDGFLNLKNTKGEVLKGNFEPWAKAYKKDFLTQNGVIFEEARLAEDLPFFYAAVLSTEKILLCKKPVYFYRRGHKEYLKEGKYDWGEEVVKALQKSDEIFKSRVLGHETKDLEGLKKIEKIYAKNCLNICLFWGNKFKKLQNRRKFYAFCGEYLGKYGFSAEFYIRLFIRNLIDI